MHFRYQCIHWYKFEDDEVERILSCTCTVKCCILEYIYIGQIAKRWTSPVFAFNMHNTTNYSTCNLTNYMTGLGKTSPEKTRALSSSPLIVSWDFVNPRNWDRLQFWRSMSYSDGCNYMFNIYFLYLKYLCTDFYDISALFFVTVLSQIISKQNLLETFLIAPSKRRTHLTSTLMRYWHSIIAKRHYLKWVRKWQEFKFFNRSHYIFLSLNRIIERNVHVYKILSIFFTYKIHI